MHAILTFTPRCEVWVYEVRTNWAVSSTVSGYRDGSQWHWNELRCETVLFSCFWPRRAFGWDSRVRTIIWERIRPQFAVICCVIIRDKQYPCDFLNKILYFKYTFVIDTYSRLRRSHMPREGLQSKILNINVCYARWLRPSYKHYYILILDSLIPSLIFFRNPVLGKISNIKEEQSAKQRPIKNQLGYVYETWVSMILKSEC